MKLAYFRNALEIFGEIRRTNKMEDFEVAQGILPYEKIREKIRNWNKFREIREEFFKKTGVGYDIFDLYMREICRSITNFLENTIWKEENKSSVIVNISTHYIIWRPGDDEFSTFVHKIISREKQKKIINFFLIYWTKELKKSEYKVENREIKERRDSRKQFDHYEVEIKISF